MVICISKFITLFAITFLLIFFTASFGASSLDYIAKAAVYVMILSAAFGAGICIKNYISALIDIIHENMSKR